ncbi:MAG: hypothetical protein H0X37_05930 [Herpetosiphonaceae bacterium]|nr:hypothetical protein [Herpetosiphonaceae bacterium]
MHVYHLVARANVDAEGLIIDPQAVRHGTIEHGQVGALAGPIDPLTHLNLDFAAHRLEGCVLVEELAVGAQVPFSEGGFTIAYPQPSAFQFLGKVDQAGRRAAWLERTDTQRG